MADGNEKNLTRREFVGRLTKAGICAGGAAAVFWSLYDKAGPGRSGAVEAIENLPGFSVERRDGQVMSVVEESERTETVNKAIELLGGIERFVQAGDTVLIKVNAAFATPAALGATTHPDLVREVVRLCYEKGKAKKVIVTDNPINDPESCFRLTGIGSAVEDAGGEVLLPRKSYFRNVTLVGGKLIKNWPVLYEPLARVDKVIGMTPVKSHSRSGASMTMKNWYGLLGGRRNIFHQDINTIIAELAMMVRPTLVILDGTEVMMTNGPTGGSISDLRKGNTMIASCDQVAADSFGATLLGLKVGDLPYLAKAQDAGVGTTDYESLKPLFA